MRDASPRSAANAKNETSGAASAFSDDLGDVLAAAGPDPSAAVAHASELGMFDDQAAPLRALAARLDEERRGRAAQARAGLAGLAHALDAEDGADRTQEIRAGLEALGRLDADRVQAEVDARREAKRILRPGQLAKLRALCSATCR